MEYKIQMSSCSVRKDYVGGLTEREAIDICEEYNWEYMDENGFVWSLDYVEDYDG